MIELFPFSDYWLFYVGFTVFVFLMLALDLGVFHKKSHEVSFKEASIWSVVWVSLSLIFNYLFYQYALWKFTTDPRLLAIPGFDAMKEASRVGWEFLTGYVIEKSLSVDNIFIFVMVFGYFSIPLKYQHKILFYGILGALVFRAIFIAIGSALMEYNWVIIVFGLFLLLTGIKMLFASEKEIEPEKNLLVRLMKKFLPVTHQTDGDKFFIKINGVRNATPLFVALVFLEATDIVFAVDSVPAIFSITREPLIVFTSNIFAILGLRSLYFLLAGAVVGLKMVWLNNLYGGHFPIVLSLSIILGVILLSIILSLLIPKKKDVNLDK
jgi:tellurite resistance protein TerC